MTRRPFGTLVLFGIGAVFAVLVVRLPIGHELLDQLEGWGYLTALLGGVFYASSLTSATGTLVLANTSASLNPVVAAIIGGLGSLLYDLLIFTIVQKEVEHRPLLHRLVEFFQRHRRLRWTAAIGGALIIASPLPDELGIALLDGIGASRRGFIPLSFGLNTLGILVIVGWF